MEGSLWYRTTKEGNGCTDRKKGRRGDYHFKLERGGRKRKKEIPSIRRGGEGEISFAIWRKIQSVTNPYQEKRRRGTRTPAGTQKEIEQLPRSHQTVATIAVLVKGGKRWQKLIIFLPREPPERRVMDCEKKKGMARSVHKEKRGEVSVFAEASCEKKWKSPSRKNGENPKHEPSRRRCRERKRFFSSTL